MTIAEAAKALRENTVTALIIDSTGEISAALGFDWAPTAADVIALTQQNAGKVVRFLERKSYDGSEIKAICCSAQETLRRAARGEFRSGANLE